MPRRRRYGRKRRLRRPVGRRRTRFRRRRRRRLPYYAGGYPKKSSVVGFRPARYRTKMKFVVYRTIDPGAGILASHKFSLTSAYDPDITDVGHQPQGYDDITPYYKKYSVLGVSYRLRGVTGGASIPLIVGTKVTNEQTLTWTTLNAFLENQSSKNKRLLLNQNGVAASCFMKGYVNLNKQTAQPWNSYDRLTPINSTAAQECTLWIWAMPFDLTSNATSFNFQIELIYDVLWTDRLPMTTEH